MDEKSVTRRKFLRAFAALSSSAVLLRFTTGCGVGDNGVSPSPVYGVRIVPGTTTVTAMNFVNAQGVRADLHNNTAVTVDGRFETVFSADLVQSTLRLTFVDINNTPIPFALTWLDPRTAQIAPNANLQPNTKYTLSVNSALDTSGKNIPKGDLAAFTTLP